MDFILFNRLQVVGSRVLAKTSTSLLFSVFSIFLCQLDVLLGTTWVPNCLFLGVLLDGRKSSVCFVSTSSLSCVRPEEAFSSLCFALFGQFFLSFSEFLLPPHWGRGSCSCRSPFIIFDLVTCCEQSEGILGFEFLSLLKVALGAIFYYPFDSSPREPLCSLFGIKFPRNWNSLVDKFCVERFFR